MKYPSLFLLVALVPSLSAQEIGGEWKVSVAKTLQNPIAFVDMTVGPDIDGDGVPEIATGVPKWFNAQGSLAGRVSLMSGKTLEVLWTYVPTAPQMTDQVGDFVDFVPDLNFDQVPDVLTLRNQSGSLELTILSGLDGTFIRRQDFPGHFWGDGRNCIGIPDVNGDGCGDYLLGDRHAELPADYHNGLVQCFSGKTGLLLWEHWGLTGGVIGSTVVLFSDDNSDGIQDVAVSGHLTIQGGITVLNGINGNTIRIIPPPSSAFPSFGFTNFSSGQDLDGDGVQDLLVWDYGTSSCLIAYSVGTDMVLWDRDDYPTGAPEESFIGDINQDGIPDVSTWAVYVGSSGSYSTWRFLSGQDGSLLWEAPGLPLDRGPNDAAMLDRTGDGIPDVLNVRYPYWPLPERLVQLSLHPFLYAESPEHSVASGQNLRYRLAFPTEDAGQPYALFFSMAKGASVLGGLDLPLVQDQRFLDTFRNPTPQMRGHLDAEAKAHLAFSFSPAQLTPLLGSTLYAAAVVGNGLQPMRSSVAVPVRIIP